MGNRADIRSLCYAKLFKGARQAAIILLAGFFALTASAQTVTYSENFTAGVANDPGSPQVDNWEAFRDGLTATYTNITVGGSQGPDVSCSDPAAIAAITTALNTDATASVPCDGRTWNVGTCIGTNELSIDVGVCTCQGASPFTLRPDVDAGNAAWGGIGATCGPGASGAGSNVDQTLTVSVTEPASIPDLSLSIAPASLSPSVGANTFLDILLDNSGLTAATGVEVSALLPSGLTFVSDDSTGAYNPSTGIWSVGNAASGSTQRLRLLVNVAPAGSYTMNAEVTAANEVDFDSTPGNAATAPGEDDSDVVTLTPVTPPPPLFCLGRPIQPLVFTDPVVESPGASIAAPQVGDVFRFPEVSPGVDALVEVAAFNNGASLAGIDNDGTAIAPIGVPDNFQPTLVGPAGDVSVDFQITIVATGTSIPGTLDFAGSAIDVDGDSGSLREYIEVSNNIVEFALNGVIFDDPADPADVPDDTRLITQANSPPDPTASAPSSAARIRFEAETVDTAASINPDEPRNIAAAFFTDVSVFEYRIGKFGGATTGRLNSLAFNCPAIDPGAGGSSPVLEEDFGDAPFDAVTNPGYGNPIHVIDPAAPTVQIGALNTGETEAGNSATASSDAGDDGVTIGGLSLQGQTLQGLAPATISVAVTNASADPGLLQVFIDWNIDGDFDDAGEHVVVDEQDADDDGLITLNITPPATTVAGTSFARFRWATSAVDVQEAVADGEVEDYQIVLLAAPPADLNLTLTASNVAPVPGETISLTVTINNEGPSTASGITTTIPLPAGLTFVSSDAGANYDETTGLWVVPGDLANGDNIILTIQATAVALGTSNLLAEITTASPSDPDSTPGNAGTVPAEDDTDTETITVVSSPPVCPAGLNLSATGGTAVSVTSETGIDNANFALGALSSAGTAPPDPTAALLNLSGSSVLVLDLGVVVPENALLTFSLARDDDVAVNNTMLEIRGSLDASAFPDVFGVYSTGSTTGFIANAPQNTIEHITVAVPSGGLQFLQFDILTGDNAFVDGISFTQSCVPGAELEGVKTVEVFDPLGEGLFALPGNDVTYTITISNIGGGDTDDDSIFLIDELPPEVVFFNGDADGPGPGLDPVNFAELTATGLDPFVFNDSVRFAGVGSAPADFDACGLVPQPGYDPDVRYVCFNPQGMMQAGDPDPSFALSFRVRIQ